MPIIEAVGGVVLTSMTLVGRDALLADWFDGCKKRLVDEKRLPESHDIVKGIRTAQLCAVRHVTEQHMKVLRTLPSSEIGPDEEPFSKSVREFIAGRLRGIRDHRLDIDVLTLDDLGHVLDEILKPSLQEGFEKSETNAREQAIARAIGEIEADAGRQAPPLFRRAFDGDLGAAGWYVAFSLYIAEELKTNERFRQIFQAGQMVDLRGSVNRILTELEEDHADLAGFIGDVHGQLDRIEGKLDAVLELGDVREALAKAEAELGTTRDLARALFRVVLKREIPDEQIAATFLEVAANWSASAPDGTPNKWGNLAPELDQLLADAQCAYDANNVERFYSIRSEIVDVEERAYARLLKEEKDIQAMRQQREALLIESLVQKEQAARAALDINGTAKTILRRLELECASKPDDRKERLFASRNEWFARGRDKGLNFDLEVAVALDRQLLNEFQRIEAPLNWALMQNNMGVALGILGERKADKARLEEAVIALCSALEERTRERVPLDWAATQNNLGNLLQILGQREAGTARLEEALVAYRSALEEQPRERVPLGWATTQNNLGNVLHTLGKREAGTARLEEALVAYRSALEERSRERMPLVWASTQSNLGSILHMLGQREAGKARLAEAVEAYRSALEEQPRERMPLEWATTQNNLGNVLLTLGKRESGTARLEEALVALRCALEERTRERVPLDWAMTQVNLGNVLLNLGDREADEARLEEAVVAFRNALKERTRKRVPLNWAMTQVNLGNVLLNLGERQANEARLEEAVATFRSALEELTRERVPLDWAATQHNLGNALLFLGQHQASLALLEEAVAAYRSALEERTEERVPLDWAATHNNLAEICYLFMQISRASGDETFVERHRSEGFASIENALNVFNRENAPQQYEVSLSVRARLEAF